MTENYRLIYFAYSMYYAGDGYLDYFKWKHFPDLHEALVLHYIYFRHWFGSSYRSDLLLEARYFYYFAIRYSLYMIEISSILAWMFGWYITTFTRECIRFFLFLVRVYFFSFIASCNCRLQEYQDCLFGIDELIARNDGTSMLIGVRS